MSEITTGTATGTVNTEVQDNEAVESQQDTTAQTEGTATETEPTAEPAKYTDADVDQIVSKKFAKLKAELEQAEANKAKAVEEAEKLAKMNATEKAEYERQQEAKRLKEMEEELTKLKQQNSYNSMSKQAASMLAEEKITANDAVLSMVVVADDAEKTQANIKAFSELVKAGIAAGVDEALKGNPPQVARQSEAPDAFAQKLNKYK